MRSPYPDPVQWLPQESFHCNGVHSTHTHSGKLQEESDCISKKNLQGAGAGPGLADRLKRRPQDSVSPCLSTVLSFLCFIQKQPCSAAAESAALGSQDPQRLRPRGRESIFLPGPSSAQLLCPPLPHQAPQLCSAWLSPEPARLGEARQPSRTAQSGRGRSLKGKQDQACMQEASSGLRRIPLSSHPEDEDRESPNPGPVLFPLHSRKLLVLCLPVRCEVGTAPSAWVLLPELGHKFRAGP